MIRAVIFDFNGVLVDDESVHFSLFREVLAQEGIGRAEALSGKIRSGLHSGSEATRQHSRTSRGAKGPAGKAQVY